MANENHCQIQIRANDSTGVTAGLQSVTSHAFDLQALLSAVSYRGLRRMSRQLRFLL